MSRQKGYKIYEAEQVNKFRGAYKAAADGMPWIKQAIEDADVSKYNRRKMQATITAVESCLERQLIMPLREESGDKVCGGCGATIKPEAEWQYCPVCGQRFRDDWREMQADEEDPVYGRMETSADVRAKIEAQEQARKEKAREYNRRWREANQDKIKAYQEKAKAKRAAAREQSL